MARTGEGPLARANRVKERRRKLYAENKQTSSKITLLSGEIIQRVVPGTSYDIGQTKRISYQDGKITIMMVGFVNNTWEWEQIQAGD